MYDEMELDKLGDEKTALFIIIDDKISSFNFLCAIMYSQLFKDLCDKADNVYHGRLPIHVRCILDEFPNSVTRSAFKTAAIADKDAA